jgi:hypothetical protein
MFSSGAVASASISNACNRNIESAAPYNGGWNSDNLFVPRAKRLSAVQTTALRDFPDALSRINPPKSFDFFEHPSLQPHLSA